MRALIALAPLVFAAASAGASVFTPTESIAAVRTKLGPALAWSDAQLVAAVPVANGPGLRATFALRRVGEITREFGEAYQLTGNPEYARKTALLLQRFAEVFPRYIPWKPVTEDDGAALRPFRRPPPGQLYDDWNLHYWSEWSYESIPVPLLYAYDAVRGSGALEKLAPNLGAMLVRRIFDPSIALQLQLRDQHTNAQPYTYQAYMVAGLVLGRPQLFPLALAGSRWILQNDFFYDGMWKEGSPSYDRQVLNNLRQFYKLAGRCVGSAALAPELTRLAQLQRAVDLMADPSGNELRLCDAWGQKLPGALLPEGAVLWGGLGLARLGYGSGGGMMQAYLNFTGKYGHSHADALSMVLFADGTEPISEIGYTHTRLRGWATTTMSHNTVVVDGAPSSDALDTPSGRLIYFSPNPDQPELVDADDPFAYPHPREYRRRLVLVPFSRPGMGYLVDSFWVVGGRRFDYMLHGSTDQASTAVCSIALSAQASTEKGEFGGLFRNVRAGVTASPFTVTWKPEAPGGPAQLRTIVLGAPGTRIMLGETPQVRPAHENRKTMMDYWRPSLDVRRSGLGATQFLVVQEPYRQAPTIQNVAACGPADGTAAFPAGAFVLRVAHAEGVDYVIGAKEPARLRFALADGRLVDFRGVQAVLRFRGRRLVWAYLFDVDDLRVDGVSVGSCPAIEGTLGAVQRDTTHGRFDFVVDVNPAAAAALQRWKADAAADSGRQILASGTDRNRSPLGSGSAPPVTDAWRPAIVLHGDGTTHGYLVRIGTLEAGRVWLEVDGDAGFEIQGRRTQFLTFPRNRIKGKNRIRLDSIEFVRGDAP